MHGLWKPNNWISANRAYARALCGSRLTAFARAARAFQVKPDLPGVGQSDLGCSKTRGRSNTACWATWSAFSCCTTAMSVCCARAEMVASALASWVRLESTDQENTGNGHSLSVLLFPSFFARPRTWASLYSEDYIVAHMYKGIQVL